MVTFMNIDVEGDWLTDQVCMGLRLEKEGEEMRGQRRGKGVQEEYADTIKDLAVLFSPLILFGYTSTIEYWVNVYYFVLDNGI